MATTHEMSGANDSRRLIGFILISLASAGRLQSAKPSGDERVVGRHIFLLDAVNSAGVVRSL